MLKHINQISEQAFLLDFGSEINIQINKYVISFADCILQEIEKDNHLKIINCVPSYNKILIQFDAFSDTKTKIRDFLYSLNQKEITHVNKKEIVKIPICYDEEFALDIIDVSKKTRITKSNIIKLHLNTEFYVYMIGFAPGFPFMGNLDKQLSVPRKLTPRVHVPAGSVAIVDNLCVIYPNQSPGGWNIIGRTPQCMFDKNKKNPTFVNAGYSVKFKSISKKQFGEMKKNNE